MQEKVSRQDYKQFTLTSEQLEGMDFAFVNSSKNVKVLRINNARTPGAYLIKGYVESDKRKGVYFQVDIVTSSNTHNSLPWSNCTCTSTHYRPNPCHHALRLRDVFLANRQEMLKNVMRR